METAPIETPFAWDPAWFQVCAPAEMTVWRGVESQAQVATWRLIDSGAEHDALEEMLEGSKPPLPEGCEGLHYLLFTPFRYTSPYQSRFRRPHEAGIWYGAESVETVCAELAYWRHRFILESAGLAKDADGLLTLHTLFQTRVYGQSMNLTAPPLERWARPVDTRRRLQQYPGSRGGGARSWRRVDSIRVGALPGDALRSGS